jgi:hypothetical protein
MNKTIRLALVSLSLGASTYAAPFMAIGDGAELFLTGTLGVRVDDNILLSGTEEDDLIFDINPGVDLTFGKDAQLKGSLALVYAFANYTDNDRLNTDLFSGDFVTDFDDGKMKLGFNLGYHELNQNTADIRGLTRRDVFTTGGTAEVEVSQITAVGGGVNFSSENYKPRGFSDTDQLTVPINFYYKWTPKVDVSLGYQYRDTEVSIGRDSNDHFFNVGARGEFSPKFTGNFRLGWTQRDIDGPAASGGGEESLLGVDASFNYEVSPKTSLQFGLTNDFGTSPQGQQQENLTVNGLVNSKISAEWSVNFGLSFREIEYAGVPSTVAVIRDGRSDDYWEAQLGSTYIINANIRLVGAYVYREYRSAIPSAPFKNNVFSFAANFRY